MDRRERVDSLNAALLAALAGWQSDVWTALPGIVESFDPVSMTCVIQPAINARFKSPVDGSISWIQLPLLLDCPVLFPGGGGLTLTFPVAKGDEALVLFSSRCIDGWWQAGGVQNQPDYRMHDLSDGFTLVGVRSLPRAITGVSTTSAQLRTDDGQTFVDVASGLITVNATNVNVVASGTATVKAPSIILKNAGTALQKLVNATFLTLFNGHSHPSNGSAPSQQASTANATSVLEAE